MCLSTVYTLENDGEMTMLCEYVSAVNVSGDDLTFTDIMGGETGVAGLIRSVDLVKNTIVVSRKEAGQKETNQKETHQKEVRLTG